MQSWAKTGVDVAVVVVVVIVIVAVVLNVTLLVELASDRMEGHYWIQCTSAVRGRSHARRIHCGGIVPKLTLLCALLSLTAAAAAAAAAASYKQMLKE